MKFYVSVESVGNDIVERYIEDGVEKTSRVQYAPTMFRHCQQKTKFVDIYGKNCEPQTFATMKDARDWIKRMEDVGLEAMGMDDFKLAYISDTYGSEIVYDRKFIRVANCDIEVTGDKFPDPMKAEYEIDAITHYDSIDDKFYVFDLLHSLYGSVSKWDKKLAAHCEAEGGDEVPQEILDRVVYFAFETEAEMLIEYISLWEQKRPAIFTGWNIEGFDIPYIMNRVKQVLGERSMKRFSPINRVKSKIITNIYGDKEVFSIDGVTILDYMDLYKKYSFTNQPSYTLDYVAKFETKKGKLPYDGPINKLRETNHQRYISYNIMDVESVQGIDQVRGFIDLAISMSYYAKMPFGGVMSPIKTWDAIIFNSLKEDKRVVPQGRSHVKQSFPGAYVFEPKACARNYIMSFDLTSLYPSIIRQVNISPETIAGQFKLHPIHEYINGTAPRPSDTYSCSPNGWMYHKDREGIIPVEIAKVFFQRKDWKKKQQAEKRNVEVINTVMAAKHGGMGGKFDVERYKDFSDDIKERLKGLSVSALKAMKHDCELASILANTNQLNRKILINSLYGALGNIYFRYFDLRNATAITLFGQVGIQWIARKINEYLNRVCGTSGEDFIAAGDTDSVYVSVDKVIEKVGLERFKNTNDLVEFMNQFGKKKMEPMIDKAYRELCEYMNNKEHLMHMDREAISCPPLGSKGIGGFWKAKKRYALNVYDMEDTRYTEPHLKIMGMETQQSSTPKAVQAALEESIRRMLQEGEKSVQEYYKQFEKEYRGLDYKIIAEVKTCNDIAKYDDNGWPGFKCPFHIRGALTYNRATAGFSATPILEGNKVMIVPLREGNPFGDKCIAWPSGTELPQEIRSEVLAWMDYTTLFQKSFVKPLTGMCEAAGMDYEEKASLEDMFDF
ncbi:DNA-directed DNA polymerase [Salmonella phage SEA1]|nr:DNA-directed DNA polymerase [Salmonella phage SEA1]